MSLTLTSFSNVFQTAINASKNYAAANIPVWEGHAVTYLNAGITSLQDPRFASGAIFFINFAIFEIAFRISKIVESPLPNNTKMQGKLRYGFRKVIEASLVMAANIGFVKKTGITLHPLVVTALVIGTLFIKSRLEELSD
jgi:hypothetical protein